MTHLLLPVLSKSKNCLGSRASGLDIPSYGDVVQPIVDLLFADDSLFEHNIPTSTSIVN